MKTLALLLMISLVLITSVAAQEGETYYVNVASVRVRAEANTTSAIVTRLRRNSAVVVLEVVEGSKVSGSTTWYKVEVGSKEGYIHASLLTDRPPRSTTTSTTQGVQATSVPSASFTCPRNCAGAVAAGLTAQQAATCPGLDRDHDGVACYGD